MTAKLSLKERLELIKKSSKDGQNVSKLCQQAGISRTIYYRWLKRYEKDKKVYSLVPKKHLPKDWQLYKKLSPSERLTMIERVKEGESVTRVCNLYGVSKTIFYRWVKRYQDAPEGKKLEALWDKKPKVSKYFNQTPEEFEKAVLSAVIQYPELSSHKLVWVLPQIGGKPILSNHGVFNVLRRNSLTTYEERLSYAEKNGRLRFASGLRHSIQGFLSSLLSRRPAIRSALIRTALVSLFAVFTVISLWGASSFFTYLSESPSFAFSIGTIFSLLALAMGMSFFIYSLKYYFTIGIVLSFSKRMDQREEEFKETSFLKKIFGVSDDYRKEKPGHFSLGSSLFPDVSKVRLERKPFISVHVALYNEKRVVERLLTSLTSFSYENYEVIIADDSTDETVELLKKWKEHPRVKILHRDNRKDFKGGALKEALLITDKKAEFIVVFDADFIPYPDTLTQFVKYYQISSGSLSPKIMQKSRLAAVQGYQWHVLNKSENWITRGVRSEYSGSYVLERSGIEIYGGLKQIAGSVYIVRKDIVEKIGWGGSITEDFEFTLKLYEQGYKVAYTPYLQAPAEAVSTIKRLIRQRMRWAEGHSFNVKKMFTRLLFSKNLKAAEKLEFIYLTPYYLQSLFFITGTILWFLAEGVFRVRLPFWTELWGWSLVFTNLFALPLMNLVALFLEEAEEKDYVGLFSFVILSYVLAPFQGYAAAKGFLEKEEGTWFRTPKTGRITDSFSPGHFYRYIKGVFEREETEESNFFSIKPEVSFALTSANNFFNGTKIRIKRRPRFFAKGIIAILLAITITLNSFAFYLPKAHAATINLEQQINIIDQEYTSVSTSTSGVPTNNSLGLARWNSANYSGTVSVYFDSVICTSGWTDGKDFYNATAYAGLYDSSGTLVSGSLVSITNNGCYYTRVRSSAITLTDNTDYTVRIYSSRSDATAKIQAARIIVVQSDASWLTKTETQVEVGSNDVIATSSYVPLTAPKFYYYDSSKFTPSPTAYFEATLTGLGASTTTYAALYTAGSSCSSQVSGSEVTTTGATTTRIRSGSITLSSGTEYMVCIKHSSGSNAVIENAKIILNQSDASNGITALETMQHFVNTYRAPGVAWWSSSYYNYFDSANFSGGTFTYHLEGVIRASSLTASGYLSTPGSTSDIRTSSTSWIRQTQTDISMSTVNNDYNHQFAPTQTSSSWLIIDVSSLQVPENTWVFIPLAIFLPKIIMWISRNRRLKYIITTGV